MRWRPCRPPWRDTPNRADQACQPKAGEVRKSREAIEVQGIFGRFKLSRDYYYHGGKNQGHCPADPGLGLEVSRTPALAKLLCLEGADEPTCLKAERHLEQTGGIGVSARQIQRAGAAIQQWQERCAEPGNGERSEAPILYVSADGAGVPRVPEELAGRKGKHPEGKAKTRQVYPGGVLTRHRTEEKGPPVREWESTPCVSSFKSINQFGPRLRQEALRRGRGSAGKVVLLIDGANGLANMGKQNFKDGVQIVDFHLAMKHAALVLAALLGKRPGIPVARPGI